MSGLNFGDAWDTDFFGNPKGGGCCISTVILITSMFLIGCGVAKGVKTLINKKDKQTTEVKKVITPRDIVAHNNVIVY